MLPSPAAPLLDKDISRCPLVPAELGRCAIVAAAFYCYFSAARFSGEGESNDEAHHRGQLQRLIAPIYAETADARCAAFSMLKSALEALPGFSGGEARYLSALSRRRRRSAFI